MATKIYSNSPKSHAYYTNVYVCRGARPCGLYELRLPRCVLVWISAMRFTNLCWLHTRIHAHPHAHNETCTGTGIVNVLPSGLPCQLARAGLHYLCSEVSNWKLGQRPKLQQSCSRRPGCWSMVHSRSGRDHLAKA